MAGFKDIIPTFNPYVSQQPVESMVKVGMMKQQQYDTNLERIYQNMGKIAGLDIIKDSDQEYLKNKMGEVSRNLQVYAAGDFSKSNLTRSVNGMITGIASDEVVKTAVQSTAKVRNELSKMSQAQKDGKSSVVNEYFLNKDINTWLNGTTPGEAFTGAWTPYIDVDSKLREVYESMEETDISIENPFQRDANGNTLYFGKNGEVSTDPSKGQTRIDYAMLKKTVKGKSAEKILNNFYTSLSADEIRQLDMNGRYHYRNATPETFTPVLEKTAKLKKDFYTHSIEKIAVELESNSDLSADEKKILTERALEYKDILNTGKIDKELQEQLSLLQDPNNLESMKASVYKDQYLRNMALNLETESVSIEFKTSAYFEADMKMKDYNLKVRELNNKISHQQNMYNLELLKLQIEQEKDLYSGQSRVRAGDVSTDVPENEYQAEYYETLNKSIEQEIQNLGTTVMSRTTLDLLDINTSGLSDKEITAAKLKSLDEMYKNWKGGKKFDNASLNQYFDSRNVLETEKLLNESLLRNANNQKEVVSLQQEIDALNNNYSDFTINGQTYTFDEIMNVKADLNKYTRQQLVVADGRSPGYINVPDMNVLRSMYGDSRKLALAEAINQYQTNKIDSAEGNMSQLWNTMSDVGVKHSKLVNQIKEAKANYIKNNSYKLAAKKSTLDMSVGKISSNVNNIINEAMNDAGSIGQTDTLSGVDFATVNEVRNAKGTAYTIEKYHDGKGSLVIDNPSLLDKPIVITVDNEQLRYYFPITQKENPLNKALDFLRVNGGSTSNTHGITGPNAAATAIYTAKDFPMMGQQFKNPSDIRFDIKGALYNNGDPLYDKYNLVYYVKNPNSDNTWVTYESPTYKNIESIYAEIQNFNPGAALEILNLDYKKQKP